MFVKRFVQKYCLETQQLEAAVITNSSNWGILSFEPTQHGNPMPNSNHLPLPTLFSHSWD